MKKILILLFALIILFSNAVNISAASGGKYTIKEADMKINIPKNWVVFTRDSTKNDNDVQRYIPSFKKFKSQLKKDDTYLVAITNNDAIVYVQIYDEDIFTGIYNFADYFIGLSEKDKEKFIDKIYNYYKGEEDIKIYDSKEGKGYKFIRIDGSLNSEDVLVYKTVINSKAITFSVDGWDKKTLTKNQKKDLKKLIDNITFIGAKTVDESVYENYIEERNNKIMAICIIAVIIAASIAGTLISRKKKSINNQMIEKMHEKSETDLNEN